ncbi:hypothetical protein [Corynebacterium striatum]
MTHGDLGVLVAASRNIDEVNVMFPLSDAGFGYRCSGDPVLPGSG